MEKIMKALVFKAETGRISMDDVAVPIPAGNQVLIKVHLTAVAAADVEILSKGPSFGAILGIEGSGVVVQDSKSVFSRKFKGKKVSFMQLDQALPGSWAEYVVCDEKYFMGLQDNIDFIKGANLMMNPLTVLMMNEKIKKGKHKSVIHLNAASDLGLVFIRWCHFSDYHLISIVKSESEAQKISLVSPDLVLVEESPTFLQDLQSACTTHKPTCGFDFCGGETAGLIFNSLQPSSELFLLSGASPIEGISPQSFIFQGKKLSGLRFKQWFDDLSALKRFKYYTKIQKVHFLFTNTLTNVYPISQFDEGLQNYSALGTNLFHFACDLQNNSKFVNEDILNQYIPEVIKARINSLPAFEWSGMDYPLKVIEGGIFKGEIVDGKMQGNGILVTDRSYYVGGFVDGRKCGTGREVMEDYWYEGEFQQDFCEGNGKMITFDGHVLEGYFSKGKIKGLGVEVLPSGERYEGEFVEGIRNGKGKINFEGLQFEGNFIDGLAEGEGTVVFEDGSVFKGIYSKGTSVGELKKPDGTVAKGTLTGTKFTESL